MRILAGERHASLTVFAGAAARSCRPPRLPVPEELCGKYYWPSGRWSAILRCSRLCASRTAKERLRNGYHHAGDSRRYNLLEVEEVRALLAIAALALLLAPPADAREVQLATSIGLQTTWRSDEAEPLAGIDLGGLLGITERITLEFAYLSSTEPEEALGRLGGHYMFWKIPADSLMGVTVGGGVSAQGIATALGDAGGYATLAFQGTLPALGEMRAGAEVNINFDEPRRPTLSLRWQKVFRF